MVAGFGRKGHAKGDIPGVRFKIVSVKGFSLKALYTGKAEKKWFIAINNLNKIKIYIKTNNKYLLNFLNFKIVKILLV